MLSFWESQSYLDQDYLIIGAGIVGLSTAASLLEKQPHARVAILERGILPAGASTKNAGFACFGSLTELLSDIQAFGVDTALSIVESRWRGLRRLRERLGDGQLAYENLGGFELLAEEQLSVLDRLDEVNTLLRPIFGAPVFHRADEALAGFGFSRHRVSTLLCNPHESQLDPGRMMRALATYVQARGGLIVSGAQVEDYECGSHAVTVGVRHDALGERIRFRGRALGVCTNAFASQLIPGLDIQPGRGQVVITEPIPGLPVRGTFHSHEGYFYFRNVGDRVLLGGGRHLDFAGESTTAFSDNSTISSALESLMHEVILPGRDVRIAQRWSGIMAFGATKKPIVARVGPRVHVGVRMGGMGIAIGSNVGHELAAMMRTEAE